MDGTGRNFDIGDKVVCINKDYYSNPYHNGFGNSNCFIKTSIVSDVYEYKGGNYRKKVFYIYGYKHQVDSIGDSCSYQYNEYSDETGIRTEWPKHEDEVWMNYTKHPEEVKKKIQEIKKEFHIHCEELREKEKKEVISEIKRLQNRLQKLEEGDTFEYLSRIRSEKEWNEKMDEIINKILNF